MKGEALHNVTALTELFGFEGSQVDLLSFPFFFLLVLCVVLPEAFVDGAEAFPSSTGGRNIVLFLTVREFFNIDKLLKLSV